MSEKDYTHKVLSYAGQVLTYLVSVLLLVIVYVILAVSTLSFTKMCALGVLSAIFIGSIVLCIRVMCKHLRKLRSL